MPGPTENRPICFRDMDEDELRSNRIRSFVFICCAAVIPYGTAIIWKIWDATAASWVLDTIPDVLFAGVTVVIGAYTNTVFSFLTAEGHNGISDKSWYLGAFLAILGFVALLTYLKATEDRPSGFVLIEMYYVTWAVVVSIYIVSTAFQFSFLSDEIGGARRRVINQ